MSLRIKEQVKRLRGLEDYRGGAGGTGGAGEVVEAGGLRNEEEEQVEQE